ncbi:MAG: DUF2723 domain-containing protein [Muribaculaceae bacterium]|nr:DUF2723 domain-containing protein [Muribaculaceae bacterium]
MSSSPVISFRTPLAVSSWLVLLASFPVYFLTVDPGVSYWDSPEYVLIASKLEIGHPPGNPLWMLAMRVATIPFPPHLHAVVINVCSAILMALASFFLCKLIFIPVRLSLRRLKKLTSGRSDFLSIIIAVGATLCFSFCDSAWFSAVETEVYAMSAMLTSLSLWIMMLWWHEPSSGRRTRLLILLTYLIGISLGVHQLNLLCVPVFALTYLFKRSKKSVNPVKCSLVLLGSLFIVAVILNGIMPGSLDWAGLFEIFVVNELKLPFNSGLILYSLFILLSIIAGIFIISKFGKVCGSPFLFVSLFLSGAFLFNGNYPLAALLSLLCTILVTWNSGISTRSTSNLLWMLGFIMLGYSSFGVIIIRANASPYINTGNPSDPFSLAAYIGRQQYPSTPLLYGRTPFSQSVMQEELVDGKPVYKKYLLDYERETYTPDEETRRYVTAGRKFKHILTPELNMWFPRITSGDARHITQYENWSGMNKSTMTKVNISETIDSAGHFTTKLNSEGERSPAVSYRPTYLQNLQYFVSYQLYYMYLRYLLWNFVGRQNDFHSTGEIEHGNFISGVPVIDNLMLGDQSKIPTELGDGNAGRNRYYFIPFLIGIIGIVYLASGGLGRRRLLYLIFWFFIMTGIAIVVYLNQTPNEPRERDYSFLGSYMAFTMWIAAGLFGITTFLIKKLPYLPALLLSILITLTPASLMGVVNFDDHNRSGRYETEFFASSLLEFDQPSVIFSYGDNSTFPLWYASEVLGKGAESAIVDISYLSVPSYMENLMKQGDKGVNSLISLKEIHKNLFNFVTLPADSSSQPEELSYLLKTLYNNSQKNPSLESSLVKLPSSNKDSVVINLRNFTGGKNYLNFKQLMFLDILASQLAAESPKVLYFPSGLYYSFYSPLDSLLTPAPFGKIYAPHLSEQELHLIFKTNIKRELDKLNSLNIKPHYADPVTAGRAKRYRGDMIVAANLLLQNGDTDMAQQIVDAVKNNLYFDYLLPSILHFGNNRVNDLDEYIGILNKLYSMTGNTQYENEAESLETLKNNRQKEWQQYVNSLTPRQQKLLSQ